MGPIRDEAAAAPGLQRGAVTVGERNALIDLVRVVSVGVVVFMHWSMPLITWTDGRLQVSIAPTGPAVWVTTWFLQVMPLVFIAGGYVNTQGVDVARRRGQPYATFLARRAKRLVLPVLPLVAVCAALATTGSLLGLGTIANGVGNQAGRPLWFLAVYLFVVALAPVMVTLHDRYGLWVPAALGGAAAAVDAYRFGTIGLDGPTGWLGDLSLGLVWLAVHQLGIVYARGTLDGLSRRALAGIVLAVAAVAYALVQYGPYPPAMIGLADAPVSNLAPPTVCIVLLAIGQLAVLTLITPWAHRRLSSEAVRATLQRRNSMLMTVYLWHIPAMLAVVGVTLLAPERLLPEAGWSWILSRPVWLAACLLVLAGLVYAWGRWETGPRRSTVAAKPTPSSYAPRTQLAMAVGGTAAAAVGIHEVWVNGMDLAGSSSGPLSGMIALAVGAVLLQQSR